DPGDEIVPSLGYIGRIELGTVIGEQYLAAPIGQGIVALEGQRVDLGIIGKPGFLDIGIDAGLDGAGGQQCVGGFEIIGLRIGAGLLGSDRALAYGDDAGPVAGVDQIEGDSGVCSL